MEILLSSIIVNIWSIHIRKQRKEHYIPSSMYLLVHDFIYPISEVSNTSEYGECFGRGASRRTMTDRPVQLPTAVHLANKRTTAVSMATTLAGISSITTANHGVCHLNEIFVIYQKRICTNTVISLNNSYFRVKRA